MWCTSNGPNHQVNSLFDPFVCLFFFSYFLTFLLFCFGFFGTRGARGLHTVCDPPFLSKQFVPRLKPFLGKAATYQILAFEFGSDLLLGQHKKKRKEKKKEKRKKKKEKKRKEKKRRNEEKRGPRVFTGTLSDLPHLPSTFLNPLGAHTTQTCGSPVQKRKGHQSPT